MELRFASPRLRGRGRKGVSPPPGSTFHGHPTRLPLLPFPVNLPLIIMLRRVPSRELAQPFAGNLVCLVQRVLKPFDGLVQPRYPLRLV